jgi:hypothetical protein
MKSSAALKNNESEATPELIVDSHRLILDAHLEGTKNYINRLIKRGIEEKNEEVILGDFSLLYFAVKCSLENYENFLLSKYSKEEISDDVGLNKLKVMCERSSGEIEEKDPLFTECRKLSSPHNLGNEELKNNLSNYFKYEIDCFLKEKSLYIQESCDLSPYQKAQEEFDNQKLVTNNPSTSVELKSSEPLEPSEKILEI